MQTSNLKMKVSTATVLLVALVFQVSNAYPIGLGKLYT